jgi:hypothetical protein
MYEPAEHPEAATGRWEEERKWETVGDGTDFEGGVVHGNRNTSLSNAKIYTY